MIYTFVAKSDSIRQGDIFVGIPRIDFSLSQILLQDTNGSIETYWEELVTINKPCNIMVAARPVAAIVITQDCDNQRGEDISLCEIRDFADVYGLSTLPANTKKWVGILTQHMRTKQKCFYLPPDPQLGFTNKMAVDFQVTLRVSRIDLENLRSFRKGRLNDEADEHFREKLSEYFRRYPYNEWYPLNKAEYESYKDEHKDEIPSPYPWQKASSNAR
jgi:hypothetical protein